MFENRPDRSDEVVLVGRSNVGKSTLMREITGHKVPTGQKPGVTRQPNHFDWASEDFMVTDLPGFGFMSGVEDDHREQIKTDIVHYLEANADDILVGVLVLDGRPPSTSSTATPATTRFHTSSNCSTCSRTSASRPSSPSTRWTRSTTATNGWTTSQTASACSRRGNSGRTPSPPITAKTGNIQALNEAVRTHLEAAKRDDLKQFFAADLLRCGLAKPALGKSSTKSTPPSLRYVVRDAVSVSRHHERASLSRTTPLGRRTLVRRF